MTPDLRERIDLVMDLAQVKRERDYLLEERSKFLGERAEMIHVLFAMQEDSNTPQYWREKIEDVTGFLRTP